MQEPSSWLKEPQQWLSTSSCKTDYSGTRTSTLTKSQEDKQFTSQQGLGGPNHVAGHCSGRGLAVCGTASMPRNDSEEESGEEPDEDARAEEE